MPVVTVSKAGSCVSAPYRLDGSEPIGILIGGIRPHGRCAKCKERSQDAAVPHFWLRLAGTVNGDENDISPSKSELAHG